jgi:AcrR family transcriptional regulator
MAKITQTKDKILKTALQSFLTVGIDQTSLNSVADQIGIKKPSIYYHFKSKEDIINHCVNYLLDDLEHRLELSIGAHQHPREQIEAIYECIIDFHHGLSILVYNNHLHPVNLNTFLQRCCLEGDGIKKRIELYYHNLQNKFIALLSYGQKQSLIKNGINKEIVSIDLMSRIEGMIALSALYSQAHINLQRQELYESVWENIKAETTNKKRKILDYKSIDLARKW